MAISKTPSLFQGGIRFCDGSVQATAASGGGEITYLEFDGGNATSVYTMGTMQYDMGEAT